MNAPLVRTAGATAMKPVASRFFPLASPTDAQRIRWEDLHRQGRSRVEAMRLIGRRDLIGLGEINDA